jgi:hypothetical protein
MSRRKSIKVRPRIKLSARMVQQRDDFMQEPINPDPSCIITPDGLTRFQRECVRAAANLQHCKAQSEVIDGTMIIQSTKGWMVRRAHPEAERTAYDPAPEPNGLIETVRNNVCTDAYARNMVARRAESTSTEAARRVALRERSARRAEVYAAGNLL